MNPAAVAPSSKVTPLYSRLQEARGRSDGLFKIVRPESLYDRPVPERHRIIFYLGHLEAFDWNLLREPLGLSSFDPSFDRLFAFGIDPVEGGLPTDQPGDWPPIDRVVAYNSRLREQLNESIRAAGAKDPSLRHADLGRLLEVAIEHRLMHSETLCYMLHQLPVDRKFSQRMPLAPPASARTPHRVEMPAGTATLGLARGQEDTFGWDNEFEEHRVAVPAFSIDAYNVTNQDFLEFTHDGGYERRDLWSDSGWEWIHSQDHSHPSFWIRNGISWGYRTMFAEISLPLDWPVYVSHDEATAYARWLGKELPSEAEWHRAACGTRSGEEHAYPWGNDPPAPRHGNFDFERWDPVAVGSYPAGNSDFGVSDLAGNGWEWTRTPFAPFPGFQPFPFYPGYSANFFDGKHFVMKGGSPRTASCMLRRSFRNWFQPHYPYVYAKFRCVEHRSRKTFTEGIEGTEMATAVIAQHPKPDLAGDVRAGLCRPGQKELPSKYLYDEIGSALFEVVSVLPEYGVTRADERTLHRHATDMVARLTPQVLVAELGSGSGKKTRWLLEALARNQCTTYCPIEISPTALARCESELSQIDCISIVGFERPYLDGLLAAAARRNENDHLLVLFLGSTIGNFDRDAAERFLTEVRRILFPGDALLLGTDLVKPLPQLLAAYDDSIGATAAFNLNLLARINRELGADFDLASFRHEARYNAEHERVEMHLRSTRDQNVNIPRSGCVVSFLKGETIWTESSHKYRAEDISLMARRNGFRCDAQWIDTEWPFAESLLIAE